MKQHLKWFRTLWLIVCFIIFGCVSSISAETATTIELFAVQETVWEEHVDSYSVRLTVRNQSGGIILDPSACVCFMDPSETIVETSIVQQHGRLRNEQALIFVAEISRSLNPDSVYVDYVQYKDEAANIQTFYFNEPTVMKRIVEPVIEQSPRQSNEATTPVILPDEETLSAKTTEKSSEHVSIIDGNAPWLQLSESSLLLVKGKTATLKASVVNGDGKKASYTWESSNPSVAKVSKGTVSAVDGGKATISCRAVLSDGSTVSASIDVTVTVPVKSLKRGSLANITMKAGNSTKIDYTLFPANATVQTLEWSSSDPDIAQVDANGTVTAVSAGKAKITATTQDGTRKSIQVSIYIPSLECSDKSAILNNTDGETLQIYYYGRNWNKDIEIHKSKDFFDYTLRQDGTLITIHLMAKSVGSGSLTITDKKDKKSKVVVSVRAERSALPFYRYMTINDSKRVYDGVMRLVFQNNTDVTIIGNTFARKFYDKSGKRIYYDGDYDYHGFNNNNVNKLLAGKTEEWYYDGFIRWGVGPGEDVWSWDYFEIALTGIKLSDGTSIRINEKDYCWFSTKLNLNYSRAYSPYPAILCQAKDSGTFSFSPNR